MRAFARTTDPETSHEAAASLTSATLRRSQGEVLSAMKAWGGPMTDKTLVSWMQQQRGTTQSPSGIRTRRAELVRQGLVYDTGLRLVFGSRKQIRWAVS